MKEALAVVAAILAVVGYLPYLRDAIKNRITPHPYTWFIWSIVSGITLGGQIVKGAGFGAIPTLVAEVLTILIFIFSLKNGFKYVNKVDHYYLLAACIGLIPWVITKDPTISVIVAVTIDVIAFTPTLRKTWRYPSTETGLIYGINVVRHFVTLGSLKSYNLVTMLHSIVMIIANTAMTFTVMRSKRTHHKRTLN